MNLRPIWIIAMNSHRESVRSKLVYSTVGAAIALVCLAMCFGMVTIGEPIKMAKDFSLFSMNLAVVAFVVLSGSSQLYKELNRKTIYNILSKSVERWQFVVGKYVGMLITSFVMILLMGVCLSVVMAIAEGKIDTLLPLAYFYIFLETIIVCGLATFFAAGLVTPVLAGLLTFGVFLAGRSAEYLLYFVERGDTSPPLTWILRTLYWVLPNFSQLMISNEIVYSVSVPLMHVAFSTAYSIGYALALVSCATWFFQHREFN